MTTARTRKTMYNLSTGILYQIVVAVLSFWVRKVFLEHISVYYLGLDGVFSNLINMLCLLDFGVGTAAAYYLIKASADNDRKDLMITYTAFTYLYKVIALILSIIGFGLYFKLDLFVNTSGYDYQVIQISFVLTFLRTIAFFLMSCPKTVLLCNQQNYYNMIVNTVITILFAFIKIIAIVQFENFYVYLIVLLVETISNYIVIGYKFHKLYPNNELIQKNLLKSKIHEILSYGKKILILNINTFIFNSTDNLIISKVLGTITVGIMSNYYMIVNAVQLFATQVIDAATASISNYINDKKVNDTKNIDELLSNMNFVCFSMGTFCSTCLFGLTNEFINLFFGGSFLVSKSIVFVFSLNVLAVLFENALQIFVNGRGLAADEIKYAIAMSIVNLTVSIIGAVTIGVVGVLIGTFAANLIMIWGRKHILSQRMHIDGKRYSKEFTEYFLISLINIIVIQFVFPSSCPDLTCFILRGIGCLVLVALSIFLFHKTDRYSNAISLIKQFIHLRAQRN